MKDIKQELIKKLKKLKGNDNDNWLFTTEELAEFLILVINGNKTNKKLNYETYKR